MLFPFHGEKVVGMRRVKRPKKEKLKINVNDCTHKACALWLKEQALGTMITPNREIQSGRSQLVGELAGQLDPSVHVRHSFCRSPYNWLTHVSSCRQRSRMICDSVTFCSSFKRSIFSLHRWKVWYL